MQLSMFGAQNKRCRHAKQIYPKTPRKPISRKCKLIFQSMEKGEYIRCTVGAYKLSIILTKERLAFQALKFTGEKFEAQLLNDSLQLNMRSLFGDCAAIFMRIEEAIENNYVKLDNKGELEFELKVRDMGVKIDLPIRMTEVSIGESDKLKSKVTLGRLFKKVPRAQVNNVIQPRQELSLIEGLKHELLQQKEASDDLKRAMDEFYAFSLNAKHSLLRLNQQIIHEKGERENEVQKVSNELGKLEWYKKQDLQSFKAVNDSELDSTTAYFKYLFVRGRALRVVAEPGSNSFFPIFLSKTPLKKKQFFELQLTSAGNREILIGVSVSWNRNQPSSYTKLGSIYLSIASGRTYINGDSNEGIKFAPKGGDTLQVRVNLQANTVEWLRVYPVYGSIGKASIPEYMRGRDLYPAIEFYSGFTGVVTLL